jgi:outer membrane protein assembly factor BamB
MRKPRLFPVFPSAPSLTRRVALVVALGAVLVAVLLVTRPWKKAPRRTPGPAPNTAPAVADPFAGLEWPGWRGPDRTGVAPDQPVPTHWGPGVNVLWRADVPGRGLSSPVVVKGRVILTTAGAAPTQRVLCYDARTGRPLWDVVANQSEPFGIHDKNSHASATPASDGERVYAAFLAKVGDVKGVWVTALDLAGNRVWQRVIGKFENVEGYGPSVVLAGRTLFIAADSFADGGFLAAVDAADGNTRWKVRRSGKISYTTPIVARLGGREQVVLHGALTAAGYDPATGEKLWEVPGIPHYCANTPAWDENTVYVSGGNINRSVHALRLDGSGGKPRLLWKADRDGSYVPSLLVSGPRLYVADDAGTIRCLSKEDGEVLWDYKVRKPFSASPVRVNGLVYWPDETGTVHVFRDADAFELVAANALEPGGLASLAVAGGRIYLRSDHGLFCIGLP